MADALLAYLDWIAAVAIAAFAIATCGVAYWVGRRDGFLEGYAKGWDDRGEHGWGGIHIPDYPPSDSDNWLSLP